MNSETATITNARRSRTAKVGWLILLGVSALLILAGVSWYGMLPQMLLENIAEYAQLEPDVLMGGEPSAFDIITMIARGYGVGYAALGLLALFVALEGYRHGTRWAWLAAWVLVAAYGAIAAIFFLAEETFALTLSILIFAALALVGLLLAYKDVAGGDTTGSQASGS